jgi:potassium efflux system protein
MGEHGMRWGPGAIDMWQSRHSLIFASLFLAVFSVAGARPTAASQDAAGLLQDLLQPGSRQDTSADTTHTPLPDSARTAAPVVSIADIPLRAEEAASQLRQVAEQIRTPPLVTQIERELQAVVTALSQLRTGLASSDLEQRSQRDLEELQRASLRYNAQLREWQEALTARSRVLEGVWTSLQEMLAYWTAAAQRATQADLPEALQAQVEDVLAEVETLQAELRPLRERDLTLLARVTEAASLSEDIITEARAAQQQALEQLFTKRSPSLLGSPDEPPSARDQPRSWRTLLASSRAFLAQSTGRVLFHLLLFLLFLGAALLLRSRSRRLAADDAAAWAARIMSRPYSTALFLALFFTSSIYPQAPVGFIDLTRLLALLPLVRLLLVIIPKFLHRPLYGFIVLYLLHPLNGLAATPSLFNRLLLLGTSAAAAAGLAWFLRSSRMRPLPTRSRWWRASLVLLHVAAVFLAVAALANVAGYVLLAEHLHNATFNSAFAALVFYVFTQVLEAGTTILAQTGVIAAVTSPAVQTRRDLILHRSRQALHVLAAVLWVLVALNHFKVLTPLWAMLGDVLAASWSIGSLELSLGMVVAFVVTMWLALQVSRFVRFILDEEVLPHLNLPTGVPATIIKLTQYLILGLGFLIAVAAAGIELSSFALLAGAFSVGLGFGLQNVVSNFVSGLILIFERPIRVGDTVEFGARLGHVRRIGMRSSTVRTFDGAEVIVPNGNLIASEVTNWTLSDQLRRIEILVGVTYGTDPKRVLDLLRAAAEAHPKALPYPEPLSLFLGFGESSLDFAVRFWTADFDNYIRTKSDVTVALYDALNQAGIEIPFPQRDLHLRSVDPSVKHDGLPPWPEPRPQNGGTQVEESPEH